MDQIQDLVDKQTNDVVQDHVNNYSCGLCGDSFIEKDDLGTHILTTHKNDKPSFESLHKNGSEICTYCGKHLSSLGNLKRHILNVHDKIKGPKCNI